MKPTQLNMENKTAWPTEEEMEMEGGAAAMMHAA
jgi:hypothetical protein